MTGVYATFLINRAIVVEPTSLIASPFFLCAFLSFSPKLSPIQLFVSKQPL